jgi:hypothetical protein
MRLNVLLLYVELLLGLFSQLRGLTNNDTTSPKYAPTKAKHQKIINKIDLKQQQQQQQQQQ